MRPIYLTTIIFTVVLLLPFVFAVPNFEQKWELCEDLNITDNVECDEWWYNTNFSEMDLKNYSILHDFNFTKFLEDRNQTDWMNISLDNYWNKSQTMNKSQIQKELDTLNDRLLNNNTYQTLINYVDTLRDKMNENDIDLDNKISVNGFNVGWKLAVILSLFISLGVAGYILYELRKQQMS